MQLATVKHGKRTGRGFSVGELKEVGLDMRAARKSGIPTDVWRKSKYGENVEQLKAIIKSIKESPPKIEPAPKKEPAEVKTKVKATKKVGTKKQKKRKK